MPTSVGDLAINVTTNTASVEQGFNRLADIVSTFSHNTTRQFDDLQTRIGSFASAFKTLSEISIAGIGVHQFAAFIEGVIDAQAHLVDLGTQAGVTASQLSALIPAAKLSGTSLEQVAQFSDKFSKNLTDIANGTGKGAAAFQALGFSARDATRFLKEPAQGLLELGQRLNEFSDDGNKAAAVQLLMGRSAAEALPFLKRLGEQHELLARTSDVDAQAAHKLVDQYRELQLRSDEVKNAVASGIVPAFSSLLKQFTDATAGADGLGASIKNLASDGTLAKWALEAARAAVIVEETFIAFGHVLAAADASAVVLADDLQILGFALLASGGNVATAVTLFGNFGDLLKKRRDDLAVEKVAWSDAWNGEFDVMSKSLTKQIQALDQAKNQIKAGITDIASVLNQSLKPAPDIADIPGASGPAKPRSLGNVGNQSAAVDAFTKAFEQAQKAITDAQIALDDFGKTEEEKTSPAMKTLIDLLGSSEFAKFTANQQKRIQDAFLEADAIQHVSASLKSQADLQKSVDTLLGEILSKGIGLSKDFADKLKILDDGFDRGAEGLKTWDQYQEALNALIEQQPFVKAYQDAAAAIAKINGQYTEFIQRITDSSDRQRLELSLLGQAPDVIARATAEYAKQVEVQTEINRLTTEWSAAVGKGQVEQAEAILNNLNDILSRQTQIVSSAGDIAAAYSKAGREISAWQDIFRSVADRGAAFITDFVQHGSSAFKNLWNDFKTWALEAFAKIAAQQVIINLTANTSLAGAATSAFVGSSPIGTLLNSGGGITGTLASLFGTGVGNTSQFGPIQPTFGSSLLGGLSSPISTLTTAFTQGATAAGGFASILGASIPVVGAVVAGLSLLKGLFGDNKPSPTLGQFQVSAGTSGFEDNQFTSSSFGNLGFADANTQYFSGQAAQAFNAIVSGALDAFKTRYSPEQSQRLAGILQSTTFAQSTGGDQSTEDFIKQYGGQILRQVVTDAFDVLDTGLAGVVRSFQGTDDEFSKFSNTLLGIYDASKNFSEGFKANIDVALQGGTQAAADDVLAFVGVVAQFGDSVRGLGPTLKSLDPSQITAFVEALGGAQQFAASFAYIGANFTTQASRVTNATDDLNKVFTDLGLAIPRTHQEFVDELNAQIQLGNTDAASSILAASDAFVLVHGTADQAAQALDRQAQSAQQFFDQNFFSGAEQAAARVDSAWDQVHNAWTQMGDQLQALGVDHIPTTNAGFRALIAQVKAVDGADSELYKTLILLAPAVFGLNTDLTTLGNTVADVSTTVNSTIVSVGTVLQAARAQANRLLGQFQTLANESPGDFGQKLSIQLSLIADAISNTSVDQFTSGTAFEGYLGTLQASQSKLADELARFTVLSAQYDSSRAEQLVQLQDWYTQQQQLFWNNSGALAAAGTIFQQRWNAIINGSVAAAQSLDDFIKSIQGLANATQGNAGQQAGIELALSSAKIASLQTQYASLDPTSVLAKSIATQIAQLQTYNVSLAGQIAHFTIYTAQYGKDIANQLVDLENWYADQQAALAGNNDALAILGDIFNDRFKAIIDGISTGVDQLSKLKVDIAEYLKSLVISDISPLTPTQKLATSRQSLDAEIALAKGGDLKALGDVTKYLDEFLALDRDFNKSNAQFASDFAYYTAQLGSIAGVKPSGQPLDSSAAIASVLPTSGKLASSDDLKAQNALLERLITALADANTADSIAERQALQEAADEITAVIGGASELK